jgi:hypothetical protein
MGLNGGIHDAFELAPRWSMCCGTARREDRLDLYDRRRRPIAREDILAQADRNRARMRERDPERRLATLRDLQAITRDRERLREFLRRSSMLEGLARAAAITWTAGSFGLRAGFPDDLAEPHDVARHHGGEVLRLAGMMIEPCGSSDCAPPRSRAP